MPIAPSIPLYNRTRNSKRVQFATVLLKSEYIKAEEFACLKKSEFKPESESRAPNLKKIFVMESPFIEECFKL